MDWPFDPARLLRTKWSNANALAQELYAMFTARRREEEAARPPAAPATVDVRIRREPAAGPSAPVPGEPPAPLRARWPLSPPELPAARPGVAAPPAQPPTHPSGPHADATGRGPLEPEPLDLDDPARELRLYANTQEMSQDLPTPAYHNRGPNVVAQVTGRTAVPDWAFGSMPQAYNVDVWDHWPTRRGWQPTRGIMLVPVLHRDDELPDGTICVGAVRLGRHDYLDVIVYQPPVYAAPRP